MKRLDWRRPDASPLVSFDTPAQLAASLRKGGVLQSREQASLNAEIQKGLPPVVRPHVLALALGVSPQLISAMSIHPARYYRRFMLPKRSGGMRNISTPRVFLKVVQWWILDRILTPYAEKSLADSVCAFRPGRSTINAALPHVGGRFLLKCDIDDFFGSVLKSKVRGIYRAMGYGSASADLLSDLTTLDGALPQGAPTSPALSNLAFMACDRRLGELATSHNMTYTRYADDLFFSGEALPRAELIASIAATVGRYRFRLNKRKTRIMGPNERRVAVGIVTSSHAQPPRDVRRKLRNVFHRARLKPKQFADEAEQLAGWASYINMFDAELGKQYAAIARRVQENG